MTNEEMHNWLDFERMAMWTPRPIGTFAEGQAYLRTHPHRRNPKPVPVNNIIQFGARSAKERRELARQKGKK